MPLSQTQKNYSLFLAASANKIADVKLYLSQGAEVVDMQKNGDCSVTVASYSYYQSNGTSVSFPLQSALHYALAAKNIEMIALLAQSALKTNTITAAMLHYANLLDIKDSRAKYLAALTNPDQSLAQLKMEQESAAVQAAEKHREQYVFDYVKLDALTFKNDQQDKSVAVLNEAIARTYVEAKKLYDSAGIFTYGMRDKARNMIKQLQHLHQHYQNIEPKPAVPEYFNNASSGNTLAEIVQKKRTPNPFVMYAKSWNHLEQVTPDITSTQKLNYR